MSKNRGPRNYVVGLPVCVTVDDYGRVTIDVDLAEITDVLDNHEGEITEAVEADVTTMSEAVGRIGNCLTMTLHPPINRINA